MANDLATKAQTVEFTTFTTKLVSDTFATLLSNQATQISAYSEMLAEIRKTLTTYINDTKDDISGEEFFAFLSAYVDNVGKIENDSSQPLSGVQGDQEITNLNNALGIKQEEVNSLSINPDDDKLIVHSGQTIGRNSSWAVIKPLIINRLCVNKYQYLKEIIQTGLVRLVVDNGTIETSLDFTTKRFESIASKTSNYSIRNQNYGGGFGGGFFNKVFRVGASVNYNQLDVSVVSTNKYTSTNEEVSISGRVKIDFVSDYKPLSEIN